MQVSNALTVLARKLLSLMLVIVPIVSGIGVASLAEPHARPCLLYRSDVARCAWSGAIAAEGAYRPTMAYDAAIEPGVTRPHFMGAVCRACGLRAGCCDDEDP